MARNQIIRRMLSLRNHWLSYELFGIFVKIRLMRFEKYLTNRKRQL